VKIIQICGTNGTGKTTLMKNLLHSGKFLKMSVSVDGKSREWWFDGQVAVVGKYNAFNCCGVDAGNYTNDSLTHVIEHVLRNYKPKTLLFEDVRYGGLFSFKQKMNEIAKTHGYTYCAFSLIASLPCIAKRVIDRSGNDGCNFDQMRSKARQVIKSTQRVAELGAEAVWVDTEKNPPDAVLSILRGVIDA